MARPQPRHAGDKIVMRTYRLGGGFAGQAERRTMPVQPALAAKCARQAESRWYSPARYDTRMDSVGSPTRSRSSASARADGKGHLEWNSMSPLGWADPGDGAFASCPNGVNGKVGLWTPSRQRAQDIGTRFGAHSASAPSRNRPCNSTFPAGWLALGWARLHQLALESFMDEGGPYARQGTPFGFPCWTLLDGAGMKRWLGRERRRRRAMRQGEVVAPLRRQGGWANPPSADTERLATSCRAGTRHADMGCLYSAGSVFDRASGRVQRSRS